MREDCRNTDADTDPRHVWTDDSDGRRQHMTCSQCGRFLDVEYLSDEDFWSIFGKDA